MLRDPLRRTLRRIVPPAVVNAYWRLQRRRNRDRTVREVFTDVYERNLWGGRKGEYCSGAGSEGERAARYAEVVRAFAREHGVRRIVDLGCGDYRVGRLLRMEGVSYVGVDVVEPLVARNRDLHGAPDVEFRCLDITSDELPDGDLCLVRQVLQHLSNDQIEAVLRRVERYPWVLVTEHYPAPHAEGPPNLDKPHGADTRIIDGSAVWLDRPPFERPVSGPLLEVDAGYWLRSPGETLRTWLLEGRGALRAR